jgi:diaminopimelate decarboxylase
MDHFAYQHGILHAEDTPIPDLVARYGTPLYVYSKATVTRHYQVFTESFADRAHKVCYAVKANAHAGVLQTLAALGSGADVVSAGEIALAVEAGIPPGKIVFSGVGKMRREMAYALGLGVFQYNVESLPELELLNQVACEMGVKAPIALRLNPDVDPQTHAKISTGKKDTKFGISMEEAWGMYHHARSLPGIAVQGVSVHIGSQLTSLPPFEQAFAKVCDFTRALLAEGFPISVLDLGGGLGVPYHQEEPPSPALYAESVKKVVGDLPCELVFEPGRMIVANAGVLVTEVIYVKRSGQLSVASPQSAGNWQLATGHSSRTFLIVDAGMNDLLRPALYGAYHTIIPVREAEADAPFSPVDIVGPVCETSDIFAEQRPMPPVVAGDLLAIRTAGAYGAVLASTYNARPRVQEVMVGS